MKKIKSALDTDGDGVISQSEIDNAIKLLTSTKKAYSSKEKEKVFKTFSENKY
jgi:hypothetical protein